LYYKAERVVQVDTYADDVPAVGYLR
jgi:hypothetical protein